MYYLVPLAIGFVAVFVKCICVRYKLKIFNVICNIVITVCVLGFIYEYLKYNNFDILEYVIKFFEMKPEIKIKNIY